MCRRGIYGAISSIPVALWACLLQSPDTFRVFPQASVGMQVAHGRSTRDSPCVRDHSTCVRDRHGLDLHADTVTCLSNDTESSAVRLWSYNWHPTKHRGQ